MSITADRVLEQVLSLPAADQVELTDRLVERIAATVPPDIAAAQLAEVQRRIAEVSAGEMALIPGAEALAAIRRKLEEARRSA